MSWALRVCKHRLRVASSVSICRSFVSFTFLAPVAVRHRSRFPPIYGILLLLGIQDVKTKRASNFESRKTSRNMSGHWRPIFSVLRDLATRSYITRIHLNYPTTRALSVMRHRSELFFFVFSLPDFAERSEIFLKSAKKIYFKSGVKFKPLKKLEEE